MRVLVTGGAGFIGSAVVRHLVVDLGYEVLTVDKLTYAGSRSTLRAVDGRPNHRLAVVDITDGVALGSLVHGFQPDQVLHLAAESHVDRSIAGAAPFIESNVVGTYTLLEVVRGYWESLPLPRRRRFRLVHVSTDEVYGSLGAEGRFAETSAYDPSSPYAASKASSDHLALAWFRTYGLPVVVTHATNNFGPRQFPEKLIPLTIANAMDGAPLPVYGDGGNVRDWLYVEDHVGALTAVAAAGRPGERYNVGAGNEWRNLDIVRRICTFMDELRPWRRPHARLIAFVADRPGHDWRYAVDAGKLRSELGWRPVHSFESALEQTVRWYLANEGWWRPLRRRLAGHSDTAADMQTCPPAVSIHHARGQSGGPSRVSSTSDSASRQGRAPIP